MHRISTTGNQTVATSSAQAGALLDFLKGAQA